MGRSVSYATGSVAKAYYALSENDDYAEDWEYFLESIAEKARSLWPSLYPCDEWLGREDHAILKNNHAFIGVSEYCGIACVWLVPRNDESGLSVAWCNRIAAKFERSFGDLVRIGQFSNGEAVFERKQAGRGVE